MTDARPSPADVVGGYRTGRLLGTGASGRVHEAVDARGRRVALKIIRTDRAGDPGFRARLRREIEAGRRMPARWTAPVLDADPDGSPPWVATTLLSGPTLERRVRDGGPLRGRELTRLVTGLTRAVAAMHRVGLAHRDLKPANVVLTPRGPMVVDFGIAHATDDTRLTRTGATLGTPAYMAPEQAAGGVEPGPAADVHALGAILVFAATGAPPYPGDTVPSVLYRLLHGAPELGATPEPWRTFAARCLRRDPAARPSATALLAGLRRRTALRTAVVAVPVAAVLAVGGWLLPSTGLTGGGAPPVPGPVVGPVVPTLDVAVPGNGPAATAAVAPPTSGGPVVALTHTAGRVVAGQGRIYVADPEGGAVTVLDAEGRTVGRAEVGRFPAALALSPDGTRLYAVLNSTPIRLAAVDTATPAVTGTVDVGSGSAGAEIVLPPDVVATADAVVVADPRTSRLVAFDPVTLAPLGSAVSADLPLALAVTGDDVRVAGTDSIATLGPPWTSATRIGPGVEDTLDLATGPDGAALIARTGNVDGVGGLHVVGPDGRARTGRPDLEVERVETAPGLVYTLNASTGTVTVLDATTLADVARIDGGGAQAADLAIAPDGRALYIAEGRELRIVRATQ